ncbi:hypothetical protein BDR06DRAFT_967930 [Suillus hirtellus]|nr:hypothetical protein BDR06DRAFT_967930 [Suillus hirtellus]
MVDMRVKKGDGDQEEEHALSCRIDKRENDGVTVTAGSKVAEEDLEDRSGLGDLDDFDKWGKSADEHEMQHERQAADDDSREYDDGPALTDSLPGGDGDDLTEFDETQPGRKDEHTDMIPYDVLKHHQAKNRCRKAPSPTHLSSNSRGHTLTCNARSKSPRQYSHKHMPRCQSPGTHTSSTCLKPPQCAPQKGPSAKAGSAHGYHIGKPLNPITRILIPLFQAILTPVLAVPCLNQGYFPQYSTQMSCLLCDDLFTFRTELKKIIISIAKQLYSIFPKANVGQKDAIQWHVAEAASKLIKSGDYLQLPDLSLVKGILTGFCDTGTDKVPNLSADKCRGSKCSKDLGVCAEAKHEKAQMRARHGNVRAYAPKRSHVELKRY